MPGLSGSSADDRPAAPGARALSLRGGGWGVMGRPLSGFGQVARVRPGPDARPPPHAPSLELLGGIGIGRRVALVSAPLAVPFPPPTITPPQSECALAPVAGRRCPRCGQDVAAAEWAEHAGKCLGGAFGARGFRGEARTAAAAVRGTRAWEVECPVHRADLAPLMCIRPPLTPQSV
eukprot:gene12985-biopygen9504